ncbi:MAG: cysteinyl-tRNA synthetase [Microgenomates group bacterium Gr01-1014_7]|nr:MAG: cysteinyl-tRNA synthetase [Microgenomates group bacterium Gr01-1014_7]
MLRIYNTLTRKIEEFKLINPPIATLYTCGPTVYDYTHIGHLRTYVGNDILRRVLETNDFEVKHVMNITDVGHLTSDEDAGEDKMEEGARQSGRTVWEVAKFFEDHFWKSVETVNIERPSIVAKATDHIEEQIKLIKKLEKNGFIYITDQAIYFDISKFPNYTKLSGQSLDDKSIGVRTDVVIDKQKRSPVDFALWFFTVGHFADHVMKWSSPWGGGFPGWHIECSAMAMEYLGDTIDIHTGGIDHISVHHTNEIAQSEAASGKQFVRFWVHHEFLLVNGEKMSKSKKNFYRIDEVTAKGFDPLALRYLFLTAHYRDKLNFTWESLQAAQNALSNLRQIVRDWEEPKIGCAQFEQDFMASINNDLNLPQAVAVMWDLIKSDYPTSAKAKTLLIMDKVLGLNLEEILGKPVEIPSRVKKLIEQRETARKSGDFKKSDKLRKEIKKMGFLIEDAPSGPKARAVVN